MVDPLSLSYFRLRGPYKARPAGSFISPALCYNKKYETLVDVLGRLIAF